MITTSSVLLMMMEGRWSAEETCNDRRVHKSRIPPNSLIQTRGNIIFVPFPGFLLKFKKGEAF